MSVVRDYRKHLEWQESLKGHKSYCDLPPKDIPLDDPLYCMVDFFMDAKRESKSCTTNTDLRNKINEIGRQDITKIVMNVYSSEGCLQHDVLQGMDGLRHIEIIHKPGYVPDVSFAIEQGVFENLKLKTLSLKVTPLIVRLPRINFIDELLGIDQNILEKFDSPQHIMLTRIK